MSISSDLLNRKGTIPIILILTLSSLGIGSSSLYTDAQTTDITTVIDNKLLKHIANESPHLGTSTKLDFIINDIQEIKEEQKLASTELQKLMIIICASKNFDC